MDLKTKLNTLIKQNPELETLISMVNKSAVRAWLVGGCLRDLLLNLPVTDIDLACADDPTSLARSWSAKAGGHWFWLDSQRRQSRVILQNGLSFDFSPLRAQSIIEDLQLRDFTINSLAVSLEKPFSETPLLDPLEGLNHLQQKRLEMSSTKSFSDDPLRLLKGIRHAVTLGFALSANTLQQMQLNSQLLPKVAGERIRDEFFKILAAEKAANGIQLLIQTGLLRSLWGAPCLTWNCRSAINDLTAFSTKVQEIQQLPESDQHEQGRPDSTSHRVMFLLSKLLNYYSPQNLSSLLHDGFRLSRYQQRLIENLQIEPDGGIYTLARTIREQRYQALVVELLEPFAMEKLLYWGVCHSLLDLGRVLQLQRSFAGEQEHGRIPDLLNGRQIAAYLKNSPDNQIGEWQMKIKAAEITGEIGNSQEAEDWLKKKLLFDNAEA